MSMARYQFTVVDDAGNIVPNAHIEVRREQPGQPLAALKSNRAGTSGLTNPFDTDGDGFAYFHVAGGAFQIRAYTGTSGAPTFERVWRWVAIGLAGETDAVVAYDFDTRADVESSDVNPVVAYLRTAGYSAPGDGGGAHYIRVDDEPDHGGKIQSSDGAWWELIEAIHNVKMYGVVGASDDKDVIELAGASVPSGVPLIIDYAAIASEIVIEPRGHFVFIASGGGSITNTTQTYNAAGGHNTPILRVLPIDDTFDVTIEGLAIHGPRLTSSVNRGEGMYGGDPLNPGPGYPSGIDVPRYRVLSIIDCRIEGTYYAGIEGHYANGRTFIHRNTIQNHGFSGVTISDSLYNNDVGHNKISDIGSVAPDDGYGINMSTSYNTPGYTHFNGFTSIHHNYVASCKRKGIDVHNGLWGAVHDNFIIGCAYAHIEVVCEGDDKRVADWGINDNICVGDASFGDGGTDSAAISFGSFGASVANKTNFRVTNNLLKSIVAPSGLAAANNTDAGSESTTIIIEGNAIAEGSFSGYAIDFNNYSELYKLVLVSGNVIDANVTSGHIRVRNALRAVTANNLCNGTSGSGSAVATSGVTSDIQTNNVLNGVVDAVSAKQPLDADLTAIAALTTASYGRSFLELANAAAARALMGLRDRLSANRDYYVRTNGDDSNNGLADTSGGAFLTLQKAVDVVMALDFSIYTVTIHIADGTYAAGALFSTPPNGPIIIDGNSVTPANVIIQAATPIRVNCAVPKLTLQNFEAQATSIAVYLSAPGANVLLGAGMRITGAGQGIYVDNLGYLSCGSPLFISGNKPRWLTCTNNSVVQMASLTITFSGTPAWGAEGIYFDSGAAILLASVTMSGAATGKRYTGALGAQLNSGGAGTASTYFPGNSNGTTATSANQV